MPLPLGHEPPASADALIRRIADALGPAEGTVWVACSGGMDSVLLLCCAARLGLPDLRVIHVNHGLQDEAVAWSDVVWRLADGLGVHCRVETVQVDAGSNLEARARAARYRVFASLLGQGDALLLGHHLNDNLEQFLFRLIRGSAAHELTGMPPDRNLGAGRLVRPWLALSRQVLSDAAREWGLHWTEDPSNQARNFDRNFLRHEVIPQIARRWPDWQVGLERSRRQIERRVTPAEAVDDLPSETPDGRLPLTGQEKLDDGALADRIQSWLYRHSVRLASHRQLHEITQRVRRQTPGWSEQLNTTDGTGVLVYRYDGHLVLVGHWQTAPPDAGTRVALPVDQSVLVPGVGCLLLATSAAARRQWAGRPPEWQAGLCTRPRMLALSVVSGQSFSLRWRGGGWRLHPAGRSGRRDVRRLFQEYGVPPWWRARVPFLFAGEDCLAAAGLWVEDGAAPHGPDDPVALLCWWPEPPV